MNQETKHRLHADEMRQAASEYRETDYKFDAFISYRHVEPDQSIARELHRMIESFKAPKEFESGGKAPTFRVFRDREELAAKDLSASIEDALQNSHYLIPICSRRIPLSEWCIKEIQTFRKLHGDERIIPLLIEGEPDESFPWPLKELKRKLGGDAGEDLQDILAADIRPEEVLQGKTKSYELLEKEDPSKLKKLTAESIKLLKTEKYRIMATILGCSFGDLKQRDKERRSRLILTISSLLGVFFLIFGLLMGNAYRKAEQARQEAVQSNASILLKNARTFLENGDSIRSILVAKEAMKSIRPDMENYESLHAGKLSLFNDSLYHSGVSMLTALPTKNKTTFFSLSDDGNYLAYGFGNDQTAIANPQNGALIKLLPGHTEQVKLVDFSPDSALLATSSFDETAIIYDVASGEEKTRFSFAGVPMLTVFSPDGSKLFHVSSDTSGVVFSVYETGNWKPLHELRITEAVRYAHIHDSGEEVLLVTAEQSDEQLSRRSLKTGEIIESYPRISEQTLSFLPGEGMQKITRNYEWANYSKDGKTILATTASFGDLVKYEMGSRKLLFHRPQLNPDTKAAFLKESKEGKMILLRSGISVYMLDGTTGDTLEQIYLNFTKTRSFAYHEESNLLAVSSEDETLSIWQDGAIIEQALPYGRGVPTELAFTADGTKIIANAPENQTIKIIDVRPDLSGQRIPAQVVSVSADSSKVLFFNGTDFLLSEDLSEPMKKIRLNEQLFSAWIPDAHSYRIANSGRFIAKLQRLINEETLELSNVVTITDLQKNKEILIPVSTKYTGYLFMPDSKSILISDETEGVRILDIESQKILRSYPDLKISPDIDSLANKLLLSGDGETLAVNRSSGTTDLYSLKDGSPISKIPGEALYISGSEENLQVFGIHSGSAYRWTRDSEPEYIAFDETVSETPSAYSDINRYHPESGLLLMIRNNEISRICYVVDFKSGRVLMRLRPSVYSNYTINGSFSPDGRRILIDQSDFVNASSQDLKVRNYCSSFIYELLSEEETEKKIDAICGGRELTEEEKIQIGIRSKSSKRQ